MTPRRRRRRAIPSRAVATAHRVVAAPAVDVDVDEPGADERTVGGSTPAELDRCDQPGLDGDRAVFDPVVEDQTTGDRVGPVGHRSAPERAAVFGWNAFRALDVELHGETVAGRRVARLGRLDPPALPVLDDAALDEQRVTGPQGEEPSILGRRGGRIDRARSATEHEPGASEDLVQ